MLEIGIFVENPFVFHVRAGGEVAQPPRAMHTAMPRTTAIPFQFPMYISTISSY